MGVLSREFNERLCLLVCLIKLCYFIECSIYSDKLDNEKKRSLGLMCYHFMNASIFHQQDIANHSTSEDSV